VSQCSMLGLPVLPCLPPNAEEIEAACEVPHQALALLHDVCHCAASRRLITTLRGLLPDSPHMPCHTLQVVTSAVRWEHPSAASGGRPSRAVDPKGHSLECRGAVLAGLGHLLASAAICTLTGSPLPTARSLMSRAQREDMWKALARREREVFGSTEKMALWPEDVEFLVNEVWGRRCVLTLESLGGSHALVLTRWDRRVAAGVSNLVLLTKQEAGKHDAHADPLEEIAPHFRLAVDTTLARAARLRSAWAG